MVNNTMSHAISYDVPIYLCENVTCRLCGCTGNNISFILLKESNYIVKQIKRETGVSIKDSDTFPKTVCRACVDKIKLIEHFKSHCIKTQKVFMEEMKNKNSASSTVNATIPSAAVVEQSTVPIKTENHSQIVMEWIDEDISNTTTTYVSDSNSNENNSSKYGILYDDTTTFNNVHVTVKNDELPQIAKIVPNKILGHLTKPRVQTFTRQEIAQISNSSPAIEIEEYEEITKVEHTIEENDETINNMYIKLNENETDGTILYRLLTVNKSIENNEPAFILPDDPDQDPDNDLEIIEEETNVSVPQTQTIFQEIVESNFDENIETIEEIMDDSFDEDTFDNSDMEYELEISNVENEEPEQEEKQQIETVDLTESTIKDDDGSPAQRKDKTGRVFVSNSHKFVKKISDKEYSCTICNEKFRYPFQAEVHVRRHTGELPFTCKTCGKSFITGFYLLKHEKTHAAVQFICEICGRTFRQAYALKDHQRVHTDENPSFKCETCGKEFFTKINYDAHKLIHAEKRHVCEICGKRFALHAVLRRHQSRHENLKFQCQLCPKLSKTREEYTQHRKRHEKNLAYKCTTCSLSFWSQKGLQMHESLRHKIPKTNFVISTENVVTENIEFMEDKLFTE